MPTPSFILPSAPVYEEGTLYGLELYGSNFVPSPMSFTRATTATRVNADGLVELVPYNLVQYSEQFDNAVWTKSNTTISANATIAPNGTTTADKLIENTVNNTHYAAQNITASNTPFTYSLYVKADTTTRVRVQMSDLTTGDIRLDYNFTTNTSLFNGSGFRGSWSSASFNKTDLSEGWVKISISGIKGAGSVVSCSVFLLDNSGNSIYAGNGTSGLFIWGAQLVEGTEALPYLKTETRLNRPRVDFSLGGCPNLLLEPQRTNLALQSSSFDNASWSKFNSTVTPNASTSPDGTQNADKIVEDTSNALHRCGQGGLAVTSGVPITFSFYAKAGERTFLEVQRINTSGTVFNVLTNNIINLSNGVVPAISGATSSGSVSMGNGWYRYFITLTPIATGSGGINLGLAEDSSTPSYLGDGTSGAFVYGFQAELGSYATSYIPTTTASVTRNTDVCVKTGASALIGQTEGTIYLEADLQKHNDSEFYIAISNGQSLGEAIYLQQPSSGVLNILFRTSGLTLTIVVSSANWDIGLNKIAIAYNSTSGEVFINGASKGTVALTALPACSQLTLGSRPDAPGNLVGSGGYKAATLWKERLTNDQLEALTGEGFNTYAEMASYYNYTLQ